ncbi:MAG: transcriptional regulator with GAF, ATPase, and Fis domain [Glaciecola sp.]|jgi:transcriptional regulator with GAF, ATPase, and Fis domain
MKWTVYRDGGESSQEFEQDQIRIGRANECEIQISVPKISRHHANVERRGDAIWYVDQGSANGSRVNGKSVREVLLHVGDQVEIGGVRLVLAADLQGSQEGASLTGMDTLSVESSKPEERLRTFSQIARSLAGESELEALLTLIVDSALALVGGERGFLIMLEDQIDDGTGSLATDDLRVRVARRFDGSTLVLPNGRLSMGLLSKVLSEGHALVSVDASQDERFDGMASVEDLRLRSIMGLPIALDGNVQGVLFVDNRLQDGAFGDTQIETGELLAAHAATAIQNASIRADLKNKNRSLEEAHLQVERLNRELGLRVEEQDNALDVVRLDLNRERGRYDYSSIVGSSEAMVSIFAQLDRFIDSDLPVLIQGESGTGKELFARAVHFNSKRKDRPFVTENCAALPDTLLESELFGHVRGAFTGAYKAKRGLFEQANGGTLFLDEVGEMSVEMQKKLLRVLQEGELRAVGSEKITRVNVRLVAASNRPLADMVEKGEFREDLYYRICVLTLGLPPLRERKGDVPVLARHLLSRAAKESARSVPHLPIDVLEALDRHVWPGNIRELENEMRRVVVLAGDGVTLANLSPAVLQGRSNDGEGGEATAALLAGGGGDMREVVADLEKRSIEAAMTESGGNKSKAARNLGLSRFALQRKLDKYGLGPSKGESAPVDS